MIEMFKEFSFEAAHKIPPFSDIHGHSFLVEVHMTGQPDEVFGWSKSLTEIEPQLHQVQRDLDHKYLNDIEGLAIPSLEHLAAWIWNRLDNIVPGLDRITVRRGFPGQGEGCTYRGRAEEARHPDRPVRP